MIVDNALYRKGERVDVGLDTHNLAGVRGKATEDHDFVWVGLHDPTSDELEAVAEMYDARAADYRHHADTIRRAVLRTLDAPAADAG